MTMQAMHDEDSAQGLLVNSLDRQDAWRIYGDGHLLNSGNLVAVEQCKKALNASVNEVHQAWLTGKIPNDADFAAWRHAPLLDSVDKLDNYAPMFDSEGKLRNPVAFESRKRSQVTYDKVWDYNEARKTVDPSVPQAVEIKARIEGWDEGYLFPTATAGAKAAAYEVKGNGGEFQFLGANAGAKAGSYVGLDAGVEAVKFESDKAQLKIGLGLDTGAGIQNSSAEVKVLGCGLSFGRETGFSLFGSEFKCKLW